ncbi:MAG: helix-turn-helix transcriptional regulator [Clostridia bacterium]|nr:helix-turn-helix transcriptional regulator [Clostridia bacterium]
MAQTVFPVINLEKTGHCINEYRQSAGLTVKEMQHYFGFGNPQAIYKWLKGQCLPSVDNLVGLSRLLDVPLDDLLVVEAA